ncbi:MAG TPA: ImcF-related family protein [Candidatus Sulfotelmatobacter sp.]|nr:ImcF-related family protein [Candidatus Sulfotelmatobacter sp.]
MTILVLLVYLVLVWVLGMFLPLHGSDVWILRGALALLGVIGASVALWYQHSVKKAKRESGEEEPQAGGTDDVDSLVREAIRRLKNSTLGRGTDLSRLPLVFLLGDSGSTKTTVLVHSALDPELLAGQVYRDTEVVPTATANIWYTRQAIFVDPAGSLMSQSSRWKRLVKLVQPARFSAAIGKRTQAPRAAIVCFDCENFLQPGASETCVSAARRLSVRLQEVSQSLGISFPVYVLFTRVDRISFFTEFVREMSKDEAAEVLGATLPLRSLNAGVYADEETRRLGKSFDEIFYSLAERRIQLLPREHESEKLPAIYEFPRELNKLKALLVQFLVDLARPSHLGTNPFLRGFYFTGVRPVVVDDVVQARQVAIEADETDLNQGATQIFRGVGAQLQQPAVAARSGGPRRMPQWIFLTSLFNDILVKDRVALAASGSSSRVFFLRRFLLGILVLIGLVLLTGFTVSFIRNRSLESRVQQEVSDVSTMQTPTGQPAMLGDLQKLERLRAELVQLAEYEENGPPLTMRWGLYTGDRVYRDAKPVYFDRFQRVLFAETLKRITENLSALQDKSAANAPNDAYEKAYNELKAYLITTEPTDHDKSTKEFLTPVLMTHWIADRDIDKDRQDLARLQFDFYSVVLAKEIPFSNGSSRMLIDQARAYLQQFAGIDRYYVQLLGKASQNNHDASFNEQYPDSKGIVVSEHKVKGAFTRGGFQFVQDALKDPRLYMSGEEWVVGKGAQELDPAMVRQKLSERYNNDFVAGWNEVLKTSSVAGYASYQDADKKLEKLTSPTSPLLVLFYFVSHNVDVAPPDVKAPFAPVQKVEPPGPADKPPDKYIASTTESYIKALGKLQSDIHALAQSQGAPDPAALNSAAGSAGGAATEVTTIITSVPVDAQFGNQEQVRRLLEEPIKGADALLKRGPIDVANGSGKGYCAQFGAIASKYPFDPNASQDASLDQLYAVLGPNGDAWKKLNDDLKSFVLKVGSRYDRNPSAQAKASDGFLRFLNRVGGLSEALYPAGGQTPHLSYTLKQLPSNLQGVQLKIGSETLADESAPKTFTWTGAPEDVSVVTKGGDTLYTFQGPWAVFKFVSTAKYLGGGKLEWVNEINGHPVLLPDGKVKSFDYLLQVSGPANPFFDMQGMKCVAQVVGR